MNSLVSKGVAACVAAAWLLVSLPGAHAAPLGTTLHWTVPLFDESQVKNSMAFPPGDGSTDSPATGWATIEIKDNPEYVHGPVEGTEIHEDQEYLISLTVHWENLVGDLTKIHIHGWLTAKGEPITPGTSTPTHLYEAPGLMDEPFVIASGVNRRTDTWTVVDQFLLHSHPYNDPGLFIQPAQIIEEFKAGRAYFNVHTTAHPMGEIRGNLSPIPEPASLALMATGVVGTVVCMRKTITRRRRPRR